MVIKDEHYYEHKRYTRNKILLTGRWEGQELGKIKCNLGKRNVWEKNRVDWTYQNCIRNNIFFYFDFCHHTSLELGCVVLSCYENKISKQMKEPIRAEYNTRIADKTPLSLFLIFISTCTHYFFLFFQIFISLKNVISFREDNLKM